MTIPVPLVSWLLLIISIYSSSFCHIGGVSGQCLGDQQSLLLQLKESLKFDETTSNILVKWNESSDCCTWEGISCDHEGRVTGLELSEERIFGGIENSTLFNLVHLKSLDLSSTYNINSTIPSAIGNLKNLTYINFSHSGFWGQIPKEMSFLRKLSILDLSSVFQTPCLENSNLTMLLQNLTLLEELYLDGVNLTIPGNEWGQALSSSLSNLRVLSMDSCSLSGPIDESLCKLQSLSMIKLDNNNLYSPVPRCFMNFSNLTSLSLFTCALNGTFPKEIFQIPTLKILDVSMNDLLDGSFPEFPQDSNLQSLATVLTNFRGTIPASIGNLQQLSTLDLSVCHYSGTLPKSMTNLTQLVSLHLFGNNFTGPIPSFHMSKNLTEIRLSYNRFTGPLPSAAHWQGLLNLVYVDLTDNTINGNIPSSLFSLPSVQLIDLSYNRFSGQLLEFQIPPSSVLVTIDLSVNELEGPIPKSFFKLKNLGGLLLSFNKFNGTFQLDMIQNLVNLQSLELSYNNLSSVNTSGNNSNFSSLPLFATLKLAFCNLRTFPDILRNQPMLSDLDLSKNQISGEIPNWIWKVGNGSLSYLNLSCNHLVGMHEPYTLPNLQIIDLSFNQLHGKIPIPSDAYHIDLSSNCFTSSIPLDIGNYLSNVGYLSLSNNSLTGIISESICNTSSLKVLDLSDNSLSGKIPTCMFALSERIGMNLARNNLSGPIPDAFPTNCSLKTLDVDGNLLTGRIPKSLVNCKALEVLNVGNNQILDTFPLMLKNTSTLRILVLQSNKFYGLITCGESIGAWPKIQILNVASNNFSGELPRQCLTKFLGMMTVQDIYERSIQGIRKFAEAIDAIQPFRYHYEHGLTINNKGLEMELVKIPKGFTFIDFSSNNFRGEIPNELGQLKFLRALNLSNNALKGHIPSSFGNLRQLESLDLSRNRLTGEIPASLSNLNFLSVLNLSYNELVGRIPKGNQIQTFPSDCFQGNEGLCGPPSTINCTDDVEPETHDEAKHSNSGSEIHWDLISVEVGFIVGLGSVIGPLVFSRKWRKRYFDGVEDIAFRILPRPILKRWLAWKTGVGK